MEFFTEHVGPDWAVSDTLKESVDECVLIDRVFYNTACKVAKVLCVTVHITITLLDTQECRPCSLVSWRPKVSLGRGYRVLNDPNACGSRILIPKAQT